MKTRETAVIVACEENACPAKGEQVEVSGDLVVICGGCGNAIHIPKES